MEINYQNPLQLNTKPNIFSIILLGFVFILASCSSVSRINSSDYDLSENETKIDTCQAIFFNYSHEFLFSITGTIDLRLNNENIGELKLNEYLRVVAPIGENQLVLEHLDVKYFTSKRKLKLDSGKNYFMIKAQPFGHKIKKVDSLPNDGYRKLKERI